MEPTMMMSGGGAGGNMIAVSGGANAGPQGSANEGLSEKMAISAIQKSLMLCEKAVKSPPHYPTPMVSFYSHFCFHSSSPAKPNPFQFHEEFGPFKDKFLIIPLHHATCNVFQAPFQDQLLIIFNLFIFPASCINFGICNCLFLENCLGNNTSLHGNSSTSIFLCLI